jgi:hypothetical protein
MLLPSLHLVEEWRSREKKNEKFHFHLSKAYLFWTSFSNWFLK